MPRMYEIAYHDKNGQLVRGGIKATIRTVVKWIRANAEIDKETEYFSVPADENAITEDEYAVECAEWEKGNLDYAYC